MGLPEKIKHIFKSGHEFGSLVEKLGGQRQFIEAVMNALNGKIPTSGDFTNGISIEIEGAVIKVTGVVQDGIIKLGSMWIP